jgi:Spy/CpxP family protein refolding chaperone
MKLLLTLSLTANLLVVGLVAGRELRGDDRRGGTDRAVARMVEMLPEERRAMAEAHFAEAAEALAEAEGGRGAEVAAIIAAITAEPYRPDALESAMAAFGASRAQRWEVLRERITTLLARLTPAERAAFAENFEDRMNRWRERRRG